MSTPKTALVRSVRHFAQSTLIHCELNGPEPLGQRGGQYIIVDTGLDLPDGKRRKRAYSFISSPADQHAFTLAVYGVPGGLGAAYMTQLQEGATLTFSGPWGKLTPPAASEGAVWVIATDTGLSAALGLVQGDGFAAHLGRTRFVHWNPTHTPFLATDLAQARLPAVRSFEHTELPAIGSDARYEAVHARVAVWLADEAPSAVYVTGDGALPERIRAQLAARGLEHVPVQSENFFNHPVRKSDLLKPAAPREARAPEG